MPPSTMYSSSIRDIFTFFNNGLRFMKKLNTVNSSKKEDLYLLFIKVTHKSLELYKDVISEEFETMQNENSDMAIDFSAESCMKLNNIIGAALQLKFIFHELGISDRAGKINPNAKRTENAAENFHRYQIRIVRAYDLKICDLTTSDPYVRIKIGDATLAETDPIYKNLNPVWNKSFDVNLPVSVQDSESFFKFEVWDKDVGFSDDLCGVATKQLYLRDSKYSNYLTHDEVFDLDPQGRLLIRVRRMGEIDDMDFWIIRSQEILSTAAEEMVSIFVDRIIRYTSAEWKKILDKYTPSSYIISFQSAAVPTEEKIEEAMKPIFMYLEKSLSLFNETLDRPRLNEFLRNTYPFLNEGNRLQKFDAAASRLTSTASTPSADITSTPTLEKQREKEMGSPSLLCLVVWNGLVEKLFQQLSEFGSADKSVKKNRTVHGKAAGGAQKKPLADAQRKQVLVYELVLEYLKAFFYCEVDGNHYGFGLEKLENRAYLDSRDLIESFAL
ncbi:hypothetical protein HDU67_008512 [Dinochytrium kinnereticum]|nr:hypothetical protein HDU67_008512 [Dinochytrium kinnereticum]